MAILKPLPSGPIRLSAGTRQSSKITCAVGCECQPSFFSCAPKLRTLEILGELEPLPRNFYTGSLLWFGDDGSVDSSILIRTVVVAGGVAFLGAGGGVVADSDAESEWLEANHKARPLARELGFDPEQAI